MTTLRITNPTSIGVIEQISTQIQSYPTLEAFSLCLPSEKMIVQGVNTLSEKLIQYTNLRHLTINFIKCGCEQEVWLPLTRVMRNISSCIPLESLTLNIQDSRVGYNGIGCIAQNIRAFSELQSLTINFGISHFTSDLQKDSMAIQELFQKLSRLKNLTTLSINLEESKVYYPYFKLAEFIQNHQTLAHIFINLRKLKSISLIGKLGEAISQSKSLIYLELNLSQNRLITTELKQLVDKATDNNQLLTLKLNFSDCKIEQKGFEYFCEYLILFSKLNSLTLCLQSNELSYKSLNVFFQTITLLPSLEKIDLNFKGNNQQPTNNSCEIDIFQQIKQSPNHEILKELSLNLSETKMGTAGIQNIMNIVNQFTQLTVFNLNLDSCELSQEDVHFIAQKVSSMTNISSLGISIWNNTMIDDEGAKSIAKLITVTPSLTSLQFSMNQNSMSYSGVECILEGILCSKYLTSLKLNLSHDNKKVEEFRAELENVKCFIELSYKINEQEWQHIRRLEQPQQEQAQSDSFESLNFDSTHLTLTDQDFKDQAFESICDALIEKPDITTLSIQFRELVGKNRAFMLANLLSCKATKLKQLKLTIARVNSVEMTEEIFSVFPQLQSLESLKLQLDSSFNEQISKQFQKYIPFLNLTKIGLTFNYMKLGVEVAKDIHLAFQKLSKSLEQIDFILLNNEKESIQPETQVYISRAICECKSLKKLKLKIDSMNELILYQLAESFQRLSILSVRMNLKQPEALIRGINAIAVCSLLNQIEIISFYQKIDHQILKSIVACFIQCEQLHTIRLYISINEYSLENELKKKLKKCKRLITLFVRN